MVDQYDRNERSRETADHARDEEAVRRLARHFLNKPPQPKKAKAKGGAKPKARRKPQEG